MNEISFEKDDIIVDYGVYKGIPVWVFTLIARACHEVNRSYCGITGDSSQQPWEDAPLWQKKSAIDGIKGVLNGNTPEQSHESWMAEKKRTGWKYGPVKDADKKEHPCFVPYAELPAAQKVKDDLYVQTARGLLTAYGHKF